jgi:hypothetical protein
MEEEQFLEACQSGAEEVVAAALLDETRAAALRAARTASGNSALALACARGHAGIVARLVAARHDDDVVMTRNAAGDSPLLFACLNAPATLRALGPMSWRDAARPNAAGLDAVSCAIVSQHPDNAETLLVVLVDEPFFILYLFVCLFVHNRCHSRAVALAAMPSTCWRRCWRAIRTRCSCCSFLAPPPRTSA